MIHAEVPAISWVVFLGNDMKNPLRYVEEKMAIVKNDSWKGTKQQFSVGAFPIKAEGKDEAEQISNILKSGQMSSLSAPFDVQFLAEDKIFNK